jgi:hypothetical protein
MNQKVKQHVFMAFKHTKKVDRYRVIYSGQDPHPFPDVRTGSDQKGPGPTGSGTLATTGTGKAFFVKVIRNKI